MYQNGKSRCARCGKRFKKGGNAYRFKAELISHFDGYIRVKPDSTLGEVLDKINSELEPLTEEEIARQVYRKFEYVVCPSCRDELEKYLATEEQR